MSIRARSTVDWENKSDSRSRLHPSNGLEIEPQSSIAQQIIVARIVLVQLRLPNQFKKGYNLQHLRQRQQIV